MPSSLSVIHPHAAGIDIGSEKIFVAVSDQPVKNFDTFTSSLIETCQYLTAHGVTTVAMEATGIYWLALFDMLESAGIEVCLVNSVQLKYVPGRKSDVQDSQWLQQLHSYGLLRSSFVPTDMIRTLRCYVRLRQDHIQMGATHILHIQKAFDLMNIKLHNVISEIMGASGLRIIRAILAGERRAEVLAELCDTQILKSKRESVIESLRGHYKAEHVFALRQALELWEIYQQKIIDCDHQIDALLKTITAEKPTSKISTKAKPIRRHKPDIDELHETLLKLTDGHDATVLPAITDLTLLQLIAEIGTDMNRWPTVKHFTSWLGLAPGKHASGKSSKKKRIRRKTRAGQIFRQCAYSIASGKYLFLSAFYKRLRAKCGPMIANVATARKLAVLYYNLMKEGMRFVEQGYEKYEVQYKEQMMKYLKKKAKQFGCILQPLTE